MKRLFPSGVAAVLALAVVLSGCGGSSPIVHNPGESSTCVVGGVSFRMHYIPGAANFPAGTDDSGTGSVNNAYWMVETEVTYELWNTVYNWATDAARGASRYFFENAGAMGDGSGDTVQHPVTLVSWRDAMVWCNALSEMAGLAPAYKYDGAVVRDSRDANAAACDGVAEPANGDKGFRLPTSMEWELAARYQDGTDWTPGNHVSGDTTSYCYPSDEGVSTVFGDYAWYRGNCNVPDPGIRSTQPVGGKIANALGLCDMSGNVCEWYFDMSFEVTFRVYGGGGWWHDPLDLQIGRRNLDGSDCLNNCLGFRPVSTE